MNKMQRLPWDNPRFRNWISVLRAEKAVIRVLTRELAKLDLKIAQLDMLMNIYRHPEISQHELARRLLVGRSNITMLLPQLENQQLVVREADRNDRRVMRLKLTDKGEDLLMDALAIYTELIDRVMENSSDAECDMVGAVMRRVAETLDED